MGNKVCTACFVEKVLEANFYRHDKMADGYLNKCKECVKTRVRKYRKNNLEKVRAYDVDRYQTENRRMYQSQLNKIWKNKNPEKYAAHTKLNNAIRDKKVKKNGCIVCGKKAHAHHEDYKKPLDVIWLCPEHHKHHHMGN